MLLFLLNRPGNVSMSHHCSNFRLQFSTARCSTMRFLDREPSKTIQCYWKLDKRNSRRWLQASICSGDSGHCHDVSIDFNISATTELELTRLLGNSILVGFQCLLLAKYVVLPPPLRATVFFIIRIAQKATTIFTFFGRLGSRLLGKRSQSLPTELKSCCTAKAKRECWACTKSICNVSLQESYTPAIHIRNHRMLA